MKTYRLGPCLVAAALMLAVPFGGALGQKSATERVILPGSGYEVVLDARAARHGVSPGAALVDAISAWLSFSFNLPPASAPPEFRFVSPDAILAMLHRGAASAHGPETITGSGGAQPDILALYDDELRTIYLRKDWSGHSATGLSIVVHELVHHHQNMAGLKFTWVVSQSVV